MVDLIKLVGTIFKVLWELLIFVGAVVWWVLSIPIAIARAMRSWEKEGLEEFRSELDAGDLAPVDEAGPIDRSVEVSVKKRLMQMTAKTARATARAAAKAAAKAERLSKAADEAPEPKAAKARERAEVAKARARRIGEESGIASARAERAADGYAAVVAVAKTEGVRFHLRRWREHGYAGWPKVALLVLVLAGLAWIGWRVLGA